MKYVHLRFFVYIHRIKILLTHVYRFLSYLLSVSLVTYAIEKKNTPSLLLSSLIVHMKYVHLRFFVFVCEFLHACLSVCVRVCVYLCVFMCVRVCLLILLYWITWSVKHGIEWWLKSIHRPAESCFPKKRKSCAEVG